MKRSLSCKLYGYSYFRYYGYGNGLWAYPELG